MKGVPLFSKQRLFDSRKGIKIKTCCLASTPINMREEKDFLLKTCYIPNLKFFFKKRIQSNTSNLHSHTPKKIISLENAISYRKLRSKYKLVHKNFSPVFYNKQISNHMLNRNFDHTVSQMSNRQRNNESMNKTCFKNFQINNLQIRNKTICETFHKKDWINDSCYKLNHANSVINKRNVNFCNKMNKFINNICRKEIHKPYTKSNVIPIFSNFRCKFVSKSQEQRFIYIEKLLNKIRLEISLDPLKEKKLISMFLHTFLSEQSIGELKKQDIDKFAREIKHFKNFSNFFQLNIIKKCMETIK